MTVPNKNLQIAAFIWRFAINAADGVEPSHTNSESAVLPLDDAATVNKYILPSLDQNV